MTSTSTSTPPRTLGRRTPDANRLRGLIQLAVATAVGFVVLTVLAGLLDPGYDPRSEAISALSSTESAGAPAMIAGFTLLGLSTLLTGTCLVRLLRGKAAVASGVLVLVAGVLTIGEGYFRQSCSSLEQKCLARESAGDVASSHVIHNLLALPLFTTLLVVGFLLLPALRRAAVSRSARRWFLLGAVVSTCCFVWFGSGAYGSNGGLVERALVLLAFGLPLAAAGMASRTAARSSL